jgi:PTH1 family peptidyl-tRNA hydrolase
MRSEGIAPDEVLVVHDDMDIPLGRIRIRKGGGSAGHNGINSLIEEIGSEGFNRMRIGVGHAESRGDVIDYVLSEFSEEERAVFDRVLAGAAEAAVLILRRGIAMAMNQYNPRDFSADEDSQPNKTTTETSVNNK